MTLFLTSKLIVKNLSPCEVLLRHSIGFCEWIHKKPSKFATNKLQQMEDNARLLQL